MKSLTYCSFAVYALLLSSGLIAVSGCTKASPTAELDPQLDSGSIGSTTTTTTEDTLAEGVAQDEGVNGHVWQLRAYGQQDEPAVQAIAGITMTYSLQVSSALSVNAVTQNEEKASFIGFDGCNAYGAYSVLIEGTLVTGQHDINVDAGDCGNLGYINYPVQRDYFYSVLQGPYTYSLLGTSLLLQTSAGRTLQFDPCEPVDPDSLDSLCIDNTESTEDITVGDGQLDHYGCDPGKPINIDGYFQSDFNPAMKRFQALEDSTTLAELIDMDGPLDYQHLQIAIASTVNTPVSKTDSRSIKQPYFRSTCAPTPYFSVGPVLTSMQITADKPLNDAHPAGSLLNDAIEIRAFKQAQPGNFPPTVVYPPGIARIDDIESGFVGINAFINTQPIAPMAFILRLNEAPEPRVPYLFTITYTLSTGVSATLSTSSVIFH